MATKLHRVYQNFGYQVSLISPTASDGNPRDRFFEIDPERDTVDDSPGLTRGFSVLWRGSDQDNLTDFYDRWAEHDFQLEVYYSTKLKHGTLHRLILQDRHDICERLRSDAYFVGYDADNPSADIGLGKRIRMSDEIDTDSAVVWILRQQWRCHVQEVG